MKAFPYGTCFIASCFSYSVAAVAVLYSSFFDSIGSDGSIALTECTSGMWLRLEMRVGG